MHEIVVNLHMHTRYSDGSGTHKDIARAALQVGLDAVIVTDHNVLVQGVEGYYRTPPDPSSPRPPTRVLLLVGQEVHDQDRDPQKNHLLVFNANRDRLTQVFTGELTLDEAIQKMQEDVDAGIAGAQ